MQEQKKDITAATPGKDIITATPGKDTTASTPEKDITASTPEKGTTPGILKNNATITTPILEVSHLKVISANRKELVRDVSLKIMPGEIVGLVGESGSGKSISIMAISGLLPDGISIASGQVKFKGQDITYFSKKERREINGKQIGLIYQDASQALNPLMKIGKQIGEVLQIHSKMTAAQIKSRVIGTMKAVNLDRAEELYKRYPHQLSGGQRQRVLIAMAIINNPELLIADEPTTALDVTVQSQILSLLKFINRSKHNQMLYISHDLSTVKELCDRVYVLYAGIPVETGSASQIIENPRHLYTKALLESLPTPDKKGQPLLRMRPKLRDLRGPITACPFLDRCPYAMDPCHQQVPPMFKMADGHYAACYYAQKNQALPDHAKTPGLPISTAVAAAPPNSDPVNDLAVDSTPDDNTTADPISDDNRNL